MLSWNHSHAGISCNIHDTDIDEYRLFMPKCRSNEVDWTSKWLIDTWKSKRSEKACRIGLRSSVQAQGSPKRASKTWWNGRGINTSSKILVLFLFMINFNNINIK